MANKKIKKTVPAVQKSSKTPVNTVRRNKIFAIAGLVALFICGVAVGMFTTVDKTKTKVVGMSDDECHQLTSRMLSLTGNSVCGGLTNEDCIKKMEQHTKLLRELKDVYAKNCSGRVVEVVKPKPVIKEPTAKNLPAENCAAIEELLNRQLSDWNPESLDVHVHISRAEIYANMMKRGCADNTEKYKVLALREIEIARALNDDRFYADHEVRTVIDTYKKLNMQAEAQKVLDTFKKLADPAIDFIIQAERIINEQK